MLQQLREICEDSARPERPVTVVTGSSRVQQFEKLIEVDRRIKLWQLTEGLQIS